MGRGATAWPVTFSTAGDGRSTAGGGRHDRGRGMAPGGGDHLGPGGEDRLALRRGLALARLAEQREGCGYAPTTSTGPDPADDPQVATFTAVPDGDPAALAAGLWNLGSGPPSPGADRAVGEFAHHSPGRPGPGFEQSAAVLRHFQADPLLPVELLPAGWPGPALRHSYDRWDRQYRTVLTDWGRSR